MIGTFRYAQKLSNEAITCLDTKKVTTMMECFAHTTDVKNKEFILMNDLSSLAQTTGMFEGSDVEFIEISRMSEAPIAVDFDGDDMFKDCVNLRTIYTGGKLID